ncbi:MAG TPA: DUF4199 domain-containing protein [Blastocatellia bacterium]|nr:DUF4199 domain-containing protein [Blastocatellia bacterium]
MKKVVLIWGLISGLIIAAMTWLNASLVFDLNLVGTDKSELLGYTSFVIALSVIFFGIKSYRDNYRKGLVTFWKGVQIGVLISLVATVFYFGGAEIYSMAKPEFKVKVLKVQEDEMTKHAMPAEQIERNMALMKKLFDNPVLFFAACFIEMFPVGLVITLICAAILRKKEILPTAANVAISVS